MVVRLLVAFGLTYALGFERQVRGSSAGDRTFSLIGVGAAVIALLAEHGAPNALAGAVTGIGFIGGGLVFRQHVGPHDLVRGLTSAAAIFAAAAIGAAAGEGRLTVAAVATGIVLVSLEIQHVPGLRIVDGRRWQSRFRPDYPPAPADDAGSPQQQDAG